MESVVIGRLLRMVRLRKRWTQTGVGARAKLSAATIGRHENGIIGSVRALESHAAVFALRVDVRIVGRAGELVRLADDEHAAIVESLATWFRAQGFQVDVEASFSEWGERGRVDLLAFDPVTGTLVIVEVKSLLVDLQDLFGALDVKQRLAASIAGRKGWAPTRTMVVLAVADTSANREAVRSHPSMFNGFARRALTRGALLAGQTRILHWVAARSVERGSWMAGRQRVGRTHRPPERLPDD
jgi:transcriptional regulator with XRE-family HTH domain